MSAQDPTRDLSAPEGSRTSDDSSDFFDEDVDYSTDLPEEEQLPGADTSDDRDDDDDDGSDIAPPPGVSGPTDTGPEPAPGAPQPGELGGSQPAEPAPTEEDDDGDVTIGGPSFQEEGGAAPRPEDLREPAAPSPDEVARQQGAEADPAATGGSITPGEAAAARELERRILRLNPGLMATDVRITGDDPDEFDVELTESGQQRLATDRLQRRAADEDIFNVRPSATQRNIQGIGDAILGVERDLETAVGRQRARRLGFGELFTAPAGAAGTMRGGRELTPEAARTFADLERGRDFIVNIDESGGGFRIDAQLTESFEERETRRAAATQFEQEFGVEVDPDEDVVIDPTGRAQLAGGAREEVQRQLSGDEFERELLIPVGLETETVRGPAAGPGPPGRTVEQQRITGFERAPLEETLGGISENISAVTAGVAERTAIFTPTVVGSRLRTELEAARETPETESLVDIIRGVAEEPEQETPIEEQSEAATASAIGFLPQAAVGLPLAAEELREFGLETVEVAEREGVGTVVVGPQPEERDLADVELRGASEFVAEESEETAGQIIDNIESQLRDPTGRAQLAGTLVGSALIFGGAAAISPRAGLAARAIGQPGEEALGIGGFRFTRRVAGERTAQRFFPQQEPLIFSEEAAIRVGRQVGRRAAGAGRRGRARATDLLFGEVETRTIRRPSETMPGFENIEFERARPGFRSQMRELFGGRTFAGVPIPRTELETETGDPREITAQDIAEPFGRPRQEPLVSVESELRREAGEAPTNPLREVTAPELETESELESRRRLESALDVGAATALDLRLDELLAFDVRPETRQIPGIDTETETEQELEQELELEFELDLETEAEAEAEAEAEFELETEFESEGEFEAEVEPFGDEEMDSFEGFDFDIMAFGAQRVTEFGTVGEAIGVNGGVGDSDGMAAETAEQILDGPASPSGFDPMPFEGDDMLDLGAPTVTGLDGPAAVPPGGSLPASVENALFDERENRSLF